MRLVFCWSNISGYMAACWRELGARPGVELGVIAYGESSEADFASDLMAGIDWTPLAPGEQEDEKRIGDLVIGLKPDAIVIAGWLNPAYVALTSNESLAHCYFAMGMDTPWKDTIRQRLARFPLRSYLARLSAAFVTGERAWQYARRLGVPGERIHRGMYGVDWEGLGEAADLRKQTAWPKCFLFVGRYHEQKGVDLLLEAYQRYRTLVPEPWSLDLCGMGPLEENMIGIEGLTDHGFVQPSEVQGVMARAGALVLPSRYDPWPLIVVEGAAAGLPLLVSEACGSVVEILRPHYNGLTIPSHVCAEQLAEAMTRISSESDLVSWGERSRALAEPYAARFWADRWLKVLSRSVPATYDPNCKKLR